MSFGTTLRAFRLGYRISDKHNALIKVAIYKDGKRVNIKIVPRHMAVPKDNFREYVCWWDRNGKLLNHCRILKMVKNPKRIISFDVDAETGEMV